MLSRTADHLFWMSRYIERAENTARMLDVNVQTSLLPQSAESAELGWQGVLSISELTAPYAQRYKTVNPRDVTEFMVRDERNPSSILSCLKAARENWDFLGYHPQDDAETHREMLRQQGFDVDSPDRGIWEFNEHGGSYATGPELPTKLG